MKALILTLGTKGDIEPYIALGRALKDAGHEETIATAEGFENDVRSLSVDFVPSNSRMLEVMQGALPNTAGAADLQKAANAITESIRVSFDDQLRTVRSTRPDIIIYHPKCLGAPHLAEFLGTPAVLSLPLPFYTQTTSYPIPFISRELGATTESMELCAQSCRVAHVRRYHQQLSAQARSQIAFPMVGSIGQAGWRSRGHSLPVFATRCSRSAGLFIDGARSRATGSPDVVSHGNRLGS